MAASRLSVGDTATDFMFDTPWETGMAFHALSGQRTAVLIFLRYYGCPVCQMEMAALKRDIELFADKNAAVFVCLQSAPATLTAATRQEQWPFTIVCDPDGDVFAQYGVEPGGIVKYLHPAGLLAAIKATAKGFRHGKFEGRETQLPAVFVVAADKTVRWLYYGKTLSDVPAPAAIAAQVP